MFADNHFAQSHQEIMTSYNIWVVFLFILISGNYEDVLGNSCVYNLLVPETNLEQTCKAYNKQNLDQLNAKIIELQAKVNAYKTHGSTAATSTKYLNPEFRCDCQRNNTFHFSYRDCSDVVTLSSGQSGWYEITPVNSTSQLLTFQENGCSESTNKYWAVSTYEPMKLYCKIEEGTGWTVIMRRSNSDVSFDQNWQQYKNGFGDMNDDGDFWIGLEVMHRLTSQKYTTYMLWVVVMDQYNVPHIFPYSNFEVMGEASNYTLKVSGFHGQLGDMLTQSNGKPFITKDHDRFAETQVTYDSYGRRRSYSTYYSANCPISTSKTGGGGWWFGSYMSSGGSTSEMCGTVNPNARVPYWPLTTSSANSDIVSVAMIIKPTEV